MHPAIAEKHISITNLCRRNGFSRLDVFRSAARGMDFNAAKIAPRTWRLRIEENVRPLIEIDNRIPDPGSWAKSDPVFIGTIMPAIIHQLFDDILSHQFPEDTEWMKDWLRWADTLMAGNIPPPYPNEVRTRREWIELSDRYL